MPTPPGGQTPLGAGPQGQPQASGNLRGEFVIPTTAESILTDAAEEITFAHSEKAEEKNLEKRKIDPNTHERLMRIEDIHKLLEEAHAERDQAKMLALAKRILNLGGIGAQQQARESFADPARQFMALHYALELAQQEGAAQSVIDRIQDAIEELVLQAGPRIDAGLNSLGALGAATTSAESVEALQAAYTDMVLGQASLADTLNSLLEQFDGRDFAKGLQSMIRALGDDLSATRPSVAPERLQALISDLYQLEVTQTLLERCDEVSAVMQREHAKPPAAPAEMLRKLVELTNERWVGANQFSRLAEQFDYRDDTAQIRFLTELKSVLRDLPVKVFSDSDSRQTLLTALQDALDAAIDREEEGL